MLQRHSAVKRALSLVLCLAIILTTCVSLVGVSGKAEAAASLPYIEELKTSQQGGAFKILEIAPSAQEGSIGYYISGAEPCQYFPAQAAADKTCYETDDTTGAVTPANNREKRIELVNNKFAGLERAGIMSANASTPLTKLNAYDEAYPWEITKGEKDGASYINTLTLSKGSAASDVYYEKVGADAGGGVSGLTFTAKPASLSDGSDITAYAYNLATRYTLDTTGAYVQDVAYYTADASQIAQLTNAGDQIFYYAPSFQNITVTVTPDVDGSGNETGTQTVKATYPKGSDTVDLPDGTAIYANEADYGSKTPSTNVSAHNFYYLGNYYSAAYTGAKTNETTLDDAHTYYFVTASGTPSATNETNKYAAVGKGFHTPAVTGETASFAPEGGKEAYKYVGAGKGTYKCEASSNTTKYILYTNTVFYTNCYKNNEWFKKYVFNYDDNELSSTKVNFVVETLAPNDSKLTADEVGSASLIFVSNGLKLDNTGKNSSAYSSDLPSTEADQLNHRTIAACIEALANRGGDTSRLVTPLIVDSRVASSGQANLAALTSYATSTLGVGDSKRVHENTYLFTPESSRSEFANSAFNTALENPSYYTEVSDAIRRTNTQRQAQNPSAALVDTTISMAACVRHIINAAQPTTNKKSIRVLDIEPGHPYNTTWLTSNTITNNWGLSSSMNINTPVIRTMSPSEFSATFNQTTYNTTTKAYETSELANSYDIIYIGTDLTRFYRETQTDNLNQFLPTYKDSTMNGLAYCNIGDITYAGDTGLFGTSGYNLSGMLDRDYVSRNRSGNITTTGFADQFRYSGNDLTDRAVSFLNSYASAGHPIVSANDVYCKLKQTQGQTSGVLGIRISIFGWSGYFQLKSLMYSIVSDKNTASVINSTIPIKNTSSDWLITKIINWISDNVINNLSKYLDDPVYTWQISTNRGISYSNIPNMSGKDKTTIDVSSLPSGSYVRCSVTSAIVNSDDDFSLYADPAQTQVAQFTKGSVNDDRIDNSSKLYTFLDGVKGRENVFSDCDLSAGSGNQPYYSGDAANAKRTQLADLVNISAPSIVFSADAGSKPIDYTYTSNTDGIIQANSMSTIPEVNGKCSLTYKFTLTNPTDQAISATRYGCNLYVDENGDGNFVASEKLSDVDVYCDDRRVTELQASTSAKTYTYSITRPMPDSFCGVIPWKLEVYKLGNEGLTASQTGFSHISSSTTRPKKTLKVLQITPNDYNSRSWIQSVVNSWAKGVREYNTIDLTTGWCKNMLDSNPDYTLTLEKKELNKNGTDSFTTLNGYDMLILGFGNSYGEMTQATASAISQYIATGKAVLFSDDCASSYFIGSQDAKTSSGTSVYGGTIKVLDFFDLFAPAWREYNFNTTLRDAVGLDRYGVSTQSVVKASDNNNTYLANQSALAAAGYSIAYKPKSGRSVTVPETQGLTNTILMANHKSNGDGTSYLPYGYYDSNNNIFESMLSNINNGINVNMLQSMATTQTVTQVNKGQITSYPYNVNTVSNGGTAGGGINADNINVSTTHMQPMQLNMNRSDVYVWYCLAGNSTDSSSLGSTYNYNTNDATNQYYIYSRGNVTYTGAGHYQPSTLAEKELIVNTIIAAARQSQTAPTAAFTDANGGKTNITSILVPANGTEVVSTTASMDPSRRIYFKIQDTSLVPNSNTKVFTASLSYKVTNVSNAKSVSLNTLPVFSSDGTLLTKTADTFDSKGKVAGQQLVFEPSKIYYVNLDSLLGASTDIMNNLGNVQFEITPSVTDTTLKTTTSGTAVPVTIRRLQLFNLG